MYIHYLYLKNFRNYREQEISFNKQINIFYGGNAQGKTNLAEALFYILVARSFRTANDHELMQWGQNYFFLKAAVSCQEEKRIVEVGFKEPRRFQVKINNILHKRSELINCFPVVMFGPDDLLLIKEGPSGRRRFLNMEASRLRPAYYTLLKDYHRVLQQRNRLLKDCRPGKATAALLEPWDRALANLGSKIIAERVHFLNALQEEGRFFFTALTGSTETLALQYCCSVNFTNPHEYAEEEFLDHLWKPQFRAAEYARGCTLAGPHLDDFLVLINGREARKFASQGQQRTAALSLKMGEIKMFNHIYRDKPVILLDDVFSEFDHRRREHFLNFLLGEGSQSFITTAMPLHPFPANGKERFDLFTVREGQVSNDRNRPGY